MQTCQLLPKPWKVSAACGRITRKREKERGFWAESEQTSKGPPSIQSTRDHAVSGSMEGEDACSCPQVMAGRFTVAFDWHFLYHRCTCTKADERDWLARLWATAGSRDKFAGCLFLAVREDPNNWKMARVQPTARKTSYQTNISVGSIHQKSTHNVTS